MSSAEPYPHQHAEDFFNGDDLLPQEQKIVKQTVRLTPEGWVFLVILAFVAFGAILRNVNLLIILAGMMFSAIILNWRSANLIAKTLNGHRELPPRVYSGKLFSIVWKVDNHSQQRVWGVNVEDHVKSALPESFADKDEPLNLIPRWRQQVSDAVNRHRRVGPNQVRLNIPQITPQNQESSLYHCLLNQRGKYQVGPATICTTFPFGLIEVELQVDNRQTLYAAPAIGKLVPHWEKRAAAMATGADSNKRKRGAEEDEFFALRKWRSGDSRRNIHWRTTAKMQQPMVRQFDEPTNRDLAIVIDLFQQKPTDQKDAQELASQQSQLVETILSFASTIAAQTQNDFDGQISIAICGQQNDIFRKLPRRKHNANLIRCLAMARCHEEPDLFSGISIVGESVSAGTPIFIVSTRPQPLWIDQLDAAPAQSYHKTTNPLFESLAYPNRELGRLTDQIRWIQASSVDFQNLFTPETTSDQARIDRFEQRWG